MDVFVETERLILRRFTMDDADALVALEADPDVMRYVPDAPASRQEILDETLPAFLGYYDRFAHYGFWAAVEKESGQFVGWFHFRPDQGAGPLEPEIGYRLVRAAWGRGYATEGARALIDKGFTEAGIERVTATAMADNVGSVRVLEKIGLLHVGTAAVDWSGKFPGDGSESVEYALDRAQWESARPSAP
jgi:RimJ/RimL family protein N-acetyltransferase